MNLTVDFQESDSTLDASFDAQSVSFAVDADELYRGPKGDPGEDGVSATHEWNGTVLTIASASGTSSADLKGDKGDTGASGADGYTPVRGTDYWTADDIAEIKAYVDEAILGGEW